MSRWVGGWVGGWVGELSLTIITVVSMIAN